MRRQRPLRGRKVNGQDDVESGERTGDKVQAEPVHGNSLQHGVMFAVKYRSNRRRAEKYDHVYADGKDCHGQYRITQKRPDGIVIFQSEAPAHERLDSLGDSRVNGDDHQGKVGDYAVGGHAHITVQIHDDRIKDNHDHAAGYFRYQRRNAAGQDPACLSRLRPAFHRMEFIMFPDKMRRQNEHADDRRQTRGERRAKYPHAARKDEHPVQHHVGKASAYHGSHGKLRCAVISHKTEQHVIEQKCRSKGQDDPQICSGHIEYIFSRPENPDDVPGKQQSDRHKKHGEHCRQIQRMSKCTVSRGTVLLTLLNGIPGAAAHSNHQSAPVNKAVNGNGQIESCEAVRSQTF